MSFTYYNLYCDESGIDGGPPFYFGAIYCSPTRASILEAALAKVREQHGLTREMKWRKVSQPMLLTYKAFLDVFLSDPYSSFRLTEVNRGPQWRDFGRDEESRFFKAYYVFLRMNMSLYSRYNVYVDDKPGKRYRWSNVQYAINGATRGITA